MGYYSTFVIRLWVDNGKMVKGTIQHVGISGEGFIFSTWDKMVDLMVHNISPSIFDSAERQETPAPTYQDNDGNSVV